MYKFKRLLFEDVKNQIATKLSLYYKSIPLSNEKYWVYTKNDKPKYVLYIILKLNNKYLKPLNSKYGFKKF